jgi:hypothetical protein
MYSYVVWLFWEPVKKFNSPKLRSLQRRFVVNDVSGQPIGLIFKGQAILEDADYKPMLHDNNEEQWSHLYDGGSVKPRVALKL